MSDNFVIIVEVITFGFVVWLGLYLLARDFSNLRLRFSGLGLLVYALALGGDVLQLGTAEVSARWYLPLLFLPAVFWLGTSLVLIQPTGSLSSVTRTRLTWGIPLAALVVYFVVAITGIESSAGIPSTGYFVLAGLAGLLLLNAVVLVGFTARQDKQRPTLGVLLVASAFLGLSLGLLLLPIEFLPRGWLLLGISLDIEIIGLAIAVADALDAGENIRPDILRSFASSALVAILFGGQVGLVMALATGSTIPMLALLLAVLTAAVTVQTLSDPIQAGLDRLIFGRGPGITRARSDLRRTASALSRSTAAPDLTNLDEKDFSRLARRALSHYSDLPRLAASPLTGLPEVGKRLSNRSAPDNTLERAGELKAM